MINGVIGVINDFLNFMFGGLIEPINSIVGFINGGITNLENTINGLFGLFGEEGVDEEEKTILPRVPEGISPTDTKDTFIQTKRGKGKGRTNQRYVWWWTGHQH